MTKCFPPRPITLTQLSKPASTVSSTSIKAYTQPISERVLLSKATKPEGDSNYHEYTHWQSEKKMINFSFV